MNLIANLVSLIGCTLMVAIGLIKKKERILWVQCLQFSFQGAAHLMLGATSGFVCCVVSIMRNIAFARWKSTVYMKVGFIILQVAMSLSFSAFVPIEMLPILSTVIFNWFLDITSEVRFKIVLIVTQAMWLCYDFFYGNYVAAVFDIMAILSNMAGIWLICRKK